MEFDKNFDMHFSVVRVILLLLQMFFHQFCLYTLLPLFEDLGDEWTVHGVLDELLFGNISVLILVNGRPEHGDKV